MDLRDRTGLLQLSFDDSTPRDLFEKAASLRGEYVIAAKGLVRERESKNPDLPTGDIEVKVTELRLLAKAATPPFEIVENSDVKDAVRLKYRYLDLRRPDMQRMIALRHKIVKICRDYFDEQGFLEIETPILTKSTPEGARDYLVPSRVHPGKFYALPQSPQQYKQLLMLAGFDRYFQIARCFRDEDLRADRQPEFTQIDLEMSFLDEEQIQTIQEGFLKRVFKEVLDVDVQTPFLRLPWREAMDRFGSDKPDMRFGFELKDISDIVKDCSFQVFSAPVAAGGSVRLINVEGGGEHFPRKKIDKLAEFVKTYKAKGLAWTRLHGGEVTSSYQKFLTEEENRAILERAGAKDGDLVLIVGDAKDEVVFAALGALRCECAKQLGILDPMDFKFLWVTEFPMFEYSEEEGRYVAMHTPSPRLWTRTSTSWRPTRKTVGPRPTTSCSTALSWAAAPSASPSLRPRRPCSGPWASPTRMPWSASATSSTLSSSALPLTAAWPTAWTGWSCSWPGPTPSGTSSLSPRFRTPASP